MIRETFIKQLQTVCQKVVQAHTATDTLRDIRREKSADKGESWRCGEQADIALGDARHLLGGLLEGVNRMPLTDEEWIPGEARSVGSRIDLMASCLLARAPNSLLTEANEFYELAVQFNILAQQVERRGWQLLRKLNPPKGDRDPRRMFSARQRTEIFRSSGQRCALCKISLGAKWHADHIVPWSKGGRTEVSNGQALCVPCNIRKGSRTGQEG